MNVAIAVREQLIKGREFVYRRRPEWNIVIRDIDVPGDAIRAARDALSQLLPADYECFTVSLEDRDHGVATVRPKRVTLPTDAPVQRGRIFRPANRARRTLGE